MALMPISKLAPECAALPVISKRMNTPPLRPVTAAPRARPGSELNTRARRARVLLDHRPRERRADLLVAGEQRRHRRRRAAELLDRGEHEAVHHQAGLHVGDARPVGAVALDLERPARRLALGKHRVAVAHQQDRPVADGRLWPTVARDGVAEFARPASPRWRCRARRGNCGCGRRPRRRRPCRRSRCRCSPASRAAPAWRRAGRRAIRGFSVRCRWSRPCPSHPSVGATE